MKLVKDFVEGRIVFYWTEMGDTDPVSPYLPTINEAEEWWKRQLAAQYKGEERRRSVHDRRSDHEKRRRLGLREKFNQSNPYGRRVTDIPIKIDIDLFQQKIAQLS